MSRYTNLKRAISLAALIIVVAVSAAFLIAGSSDPIPATIYQASYRNIDADPRINKYGGREVFARTLALAPGLSDLSFKSKLPDNLNAENYWQEVRLEIKTPNKTLPVHVIPEESSVRSGKLPDGSVFRWAFITGSITVHQGKQQEVTVTLVDLPSQDDFSCVVTISARDNIPPVALAFGKLKVTPEMVEVIKSNQP